MSRKLFFNVLVISILLTFVLMIPESISIINTSYGTSYDQMSRDDWAKIENMSYKDAMEYMKTHSRKMDGLEIFKNYFSSFYMFSQFILGFVHPFIIIFVTAFITASRIVKINRSASHNDTQTTNISS